MLSFHVIVSLIGIVGIVVLVGMLDARRMAGLTAVFLVTTVLTSITGYGPDLPRILLLCASACGGPGSREPSR